MKKSVCFILILALFMAGGINVFASDSTNTQIGINAIGTTTYYSSPPYGNSSDYTRNKVTKSYNVDLPTPLESVTLKAFKDIMVWATGMQIPSYIADLYAEANRNDPYTRALSFTHTTTEYKVVTGSVRYIKVVYQCYGAKNQQGYLGTKVMYIRETPY